MENIRKNWLRIYIVQLVSTFVPLVFGWLFGMEIPLIVVISMVIGAIVNIFITKHCTLDKKGTKWLTYMMITNVAIIPCSIYLVWNKLAAGDALIATDYGVFFAPLSFVFIYYSYLLRKEYINARES